MKRDSKFYKEASDCRFFTGEKPCEFHKIYGLGCYKCKFYDKVKTRILIIKMGAKGDVLRTTALLPALKGKYRQSHISWVVEKDSVDILENTGLIDRIMDFSPENLTVLSAEKFDLLINLELSALSSSIAEKLKASEKKGFGLTEKGKVYPFNPEAEEWFRMSIFDDLKRKNKKTYQEVMFELCGLIPQRIKAGMGRKAELNRKGKISPGKYEIIINLTHDEEKKAYLFAKKHGLAVHSERGSRKKIKRHPVIGLNTGAGRRWQLKKWTRAGYLRLIERLCGELGAKVLLFGSKSEKARNLWLRENSPFPVIDTGSRNTLRGFFSLLNLCDVIVTGDTLSAHAAVALKKKAVILFGPTSASEVELYGRGEKVIAPLDCVGCYLTRCNKTPSCMDLISAEEVFNSVRNLLKFNQNI